MSDGVFDSLFVKDLEEAEKLKKEYSEFMERKQTKEQKELQKKMEGKEAPVFWIVKRQGIFYQNVCPVPKDVVELQCRSWLLDLKKVLEEKMKVKE